MSALAGLLLLAGVQGAPPPPAPPPSDATFLDRQDAAMRALGVSPPGVAQVRAGSVALLARRAAQRAQERAAHAELQASVMASPVDPARIERALRARDAAEAEARAQRTAALVDTLKRLAPADRALVARAMLAPRGPDGLPRPPGPPGPPPPR